MTIIAPSTVKLELTCYVFSVLMIINIGELYIILADLVTCVNTVHVDFHCGNCYCFTDLLVLFSVTKLVIV